MIQLDSKNDVDDFIRFNIDKVVCLRIGKELEQDTMVLDDTVRRWSYFMLYLR